MTEQRSRGKRRRGGEINALTERLARASSGLAWEDMAGEERAEWVAAWHETALALRARRALPISDEEVTMIARTQRQIEPAGSGPPTRGMAQAAQMVVDLRIRG